MIKITKDVTEQVLRAVQNMERKKLLVGIPSDRAVRKDDGHSINNAALGYIHENGSPANNIPARPSLVPGVRAVKGKCADILQDSATDAFTDDGAIERGLNACGLVAQASVRKTMTEGEGFEPLKEGTLRARARKGREGAAQELASRKAGNKPNPANARPLIDTGQLRNSMTYVVRDKK